MNQLLRRLKELELESYQLQPRYLKQGKEWIPNENHPPEAAWRSLIDWAERCLAEDQKHA